MKLGGKVVYFKYLNYYKKKLSRPRGTIFMACILHEFSSVLCWLANWAILNHSIFILSIFLKEKSYMLFLSLPFLVGSVALSPSPLVRERFNRGEK